MDFLRKSFGSRKLTLDDHTTQTELSQQSIDISPTATTPIICTGLVTSLNLCGQFYELKFLYGANSNPAELNQHQHSRAS